MESWVTIAANELEAYQALVLNASIRRAASTKKATLLISSKEISENLRSALKHAFDVCIEMDEQKQVNQDGKDGKPNLNLSNDNHINDKFKNWTGLLHNCWSLDEALWSKCIFISPNSLILENVDALFEQEAPANKELIAISNNNDEFLTFMMIYKPSMSRFKQLAVLHNKHNLENNYKARTQVENLIINEVFKDSWTPLQHVKIVNDNNLETLKQGNDLKPVMVRLNGWKPSTSVLENYIYDLFNSIDNAKIDGFNNNNQKLMNDLLASLPKITSSSNIEKPLSSKADIELEDSIAIIGMSCRFPGANSPQEFWNLLSQGIDGVRPFPSDREKYQQYSVQLGRDVEAFECGSLSCPIDEFDARFFGISPREAQFIDPQQRLLLEVSWQALESAGIAPLSLKGSATSAYVGVHMRDYEKFVKPANAQEYHHSYLGNAFSATASRISFFLGLTGPNLAIESGCSSSMVGIHLACEGLKRGESNLALASGVNLILEKNLKVGATLMAVLSPDSRCKSFDASANGFARAEGVATLVLKRANDAVKDGNQILALIRGSAINNDGPGLSFGTPNAIAQENVIKEALRSAGLKANQVSFVEAHGTGTRVGDPLEIQALTKAYGGVQRTEPLVIGSVKTNIGHTESAAGVAGVIKTILCLQHGQIPPNLHLKNLNPGINLDAIPAIIPTSLTEWNSGGPRIAGISSFSMSGTSGHVILQETPSYMLLKERETEGIKPIQHQHLVTISAKSQTSFDALISKYVDYIRDNSKHLSLESLAYTSNVGRSHFPYRVAISASNTTEFADKLANKSYTSSKILGSSSSRPKIGFLFTGQGSQYLGMGQGLYNHSSAFRASLDECEELYKAALGASLKDIIWNVSGNSNNRLDETIYCQPALFCFEVALSAFWKDLGIIPDFVLGHSVGEFAAAVTAGLLSLKTALNLVVERSRLVQALPKGAMLVLRTNAETVSRLIKEFEANSATINEEGGVDIAAINSSTEAVVSGSIASITQFELFALNNHVKTKRLASSHAFHSRTMDPVMEPFTAYTASVISYQNSNLNCSYISGTHAKELELADFKSNPAYWAQHLRQTVQFSSASQCLVESGSNVFIEIGPSPVLLALTMANLADNNNDGSAAPHVFCPTLQPNNNNADDWGVLMNSLSKLYIAGVELNWTALYESRPIMAADLPTYAFDRQIHWFGSNNNKPEANKGIQYIHPILGKPLPTSLPETIHNNELLVQDGRPLKYLVDHQIGDLIILPAASFVEACLRVGQDLLTGKSGNSNSNSNGGGPLLVENIYIESALVLSTSKPALAETIVKEVEENLVGGGLAYDIYLNKGLRLNNDDNEIRWKRSARGQFNPSAPVPTRTNSNIDVDALKASLSYKDNSRLQASYKVLARKGIHFGPRFQSLSCAWTSDTELLIQVEPSKLNITDVNSNYVVHPILIDAMIQAFAFGFNLNADDENEIENNEFLQLPLSIAQFVWFGNSANATDKLYLYCSKANGEELGVVSLYNESGTTCLAVMNGLELIRINVASFVRNLTAESVGRPKLPGFYSQVWRPIKQLESSSNPAGVSNEPAKTWILFGTKHEPGANNESDTLVDHMRNLLAAADKTVIIILHDSSSTEIIQKTNNNKWIINFQNESHFEELFNRLSSDEAIFANQDSFKADIEGFVYFSTRAGGSVDGAAMEDEQKTTCGGLLSLCQQIIKQKIGTIPGAKTMLLVVTKGVYYYGDDDEPSELSNLCSLDVPNHATTWGLIRNFNGECHYVDTRIVDIAAGSQGHTGEISQHLMTIITHGSPSEKFLLLKHDNNLYSQRLIQAPKSREPLSLPMTERYSIVAPSNGLISDLRITPTFKQNIIPDYSVEVQVAAVGLNFRDLMVILKPEGHESFLPASTRDYLGLDVSGTVTRVGSKVSRWVVGDEVVSSAVYGLQSHAIIHEKCMIKKPSFISWTGAATIPTVYLTSWFTLIKTAHISSRDSILIHLGTGGMGLSAIQIAKSVGATIYTTAGSARKRRYLTQVLGLTHVYNSRNLDFGPQILKDSSGQGVSIVLNSLVAPGFKETTLSCLAPGGIFLEISKVNIWSPEEVQGLRPDVKYHVCDLYPSIMLGGDDGSEIPKFVSEVGPMLDAGSISVLPNTCFELGRVRDAFAYFQKTKHIGKVVIKMPIPTSQAQQQSPSSVGIVSNYNSRLIHQMFDPSVTYLITGGLGGIGLETTKWMISHGAKYIVVVSRNVANHPESLQIVNDLNSTNKDVTVLAISADVGNMAAAAKLLQDIESSSMLPPLRGIFHAAGLLQDSVIPKLTWHKFNSVLQSKVYGAWNLHLLTLQMQLDYFVMYSSTASAIATVVQANYSAGCAFLDSLVHYRQAMGLVGTSINWGAWNEVGLAAKLWTGQYGMFGFKLMSPAQGTASLQEILSVGVVPQMIVADVEDWASLESHMNLKGYLEEIINYHDDGGNTNGGGKVVGEEEELWRKAAAAETDEPPQKQFKMEEFVKFAVRSILRIGTNEMITNDTDLGDLGVDSLMAMELRNNIQKHLGANALLTANAMQDHRTIKALASHLISIISVPVGGVGPRAEADAAAAAILTQDSFNAFVKSDCVLPEDILKLATKELSRAVELSNIKNILLIGATGFVGVHILSSLLSSTNNYNITCLVRGNSLEEASARILKTCTAHGIEMEGIELSSKIQIVIGDIVQDHLGLDSSVYTSLAKGIDAVINASGKVHLIEEYEATTRTNSIRSVNVLGLLNIFRFLLSSKIKAFYHSSYLNAVPSLTSEGLITEEWLSFETDYTPQLKNGYILSKFIGEVLISELVSKLHVPATVLRFPVLWSSTSVAKNNAPQNSSGGGGVVSSHPHSFAKTSLQLRKFPSIPAYQETTGFPIMLTSIATHILLQLLQGSGSGSGSVQLGIYNLFTNTIISPFALKRLLTEAGLEYQILPMMELRDEVFNTATAKDTNNNNSNNNWSILTYRYLYEDGHQGNLRLYELHPLVKADVQYPALHDEEAFTRKMKRNVQMSACSDYDLNIQDILKASFKELLQ